jgi:hypothetical protein
MTFRAGESGQRCGILKEQRSGDVSEEVLEALPALPALSRVIRCGRLHL